MPLNFHKYYILKLTPKKVHMENDIPKKIPPQMGTSIKIVDQTSTPKQIAKFKILNPAK